MKKLISTMALAVIAISSFAQESSITWNTTAQKIDDNTYRVIIAGSIPAGWHTYSQTNSPDDGPVPTSVKFAKNPLLTLQGTTKEKGDIKNNFDKNFGKTVKFFNDKVVYEQVIKVRGNLKTNVSGTINYMMCNDHECLPPRDENFSVKL